MQHFSLNADELEMNLHKNGIHLEDLHLNYSVMLEIEMFS